MRNLTALILSLALGIALLLAQQGYFHPAPPADPSPLFVDVSHEVGIGNTRLPGIEMTSGQAWGDYDRDGWVDFYVTDSKGKNSLYRNNGDGSFHLSPLNEQVALPNAYSNGATFADYDNDGWLDLYVANWGQDALFHNQNGQGFLNVTRQAGIDNDNNSKTASWGDFDSDGYLDLYVANWSCYPKCGRPLDGDTDRLYHNNGDGTFSNVTQYLRGGVNGAGFVATFHDYDNDGDQDIYLVNDEFVNPIGNKLWRNDGPGCDGWCFTHLAQQAGADSKVFGMGLAVGDYNNDGWFDYYYSNVGAMELLTSNRDGTFTENAAQAGVDSPAVGWATLFLDYDNDGWRDLYLAVADTLTHEDIAANRLYHNNADGTFRAVSCQNEAADPHMSIGAASADYNHDGWVDILLGNMDEGYRLLQNRAGQNSQNHWLALDLHGAGKVNRDAVGTRVTLRTPDGVTQMQEVISGTGMGSGNELTLYFGTGKHPKADITVRWSDGTTQTFPATAANQRYRLDYPQQEQTSLQILPSLAHPPASAAAPAPTPLTLPQVGNSLAATLAAFGLTLALTPKPSPGGAKASLLLAALVLLLTHLPPSADSQLRAALQNAEVRPLTPLPAAPAAQVKLGEALFWDPELSGNRDTACVTCHHPLLGTGDNLALSIGTGGNGLGIQRTKAEDRRDFIARNAPAVLDFGYEEWHTMFWDGRVFRRADGSFYTPASARTPAGLQSLAAAQALFPITSRDEMRGLRGDKDIFGKPNELAMIPDYAPAELWQAIMNRLLKIPAYVELFRAAYPQTNPADFNITHAANALGAYENTAFTFADSLFDLYLRGENAALTPQQKQGAALFYGKAGCATCHSGALLTDQKFYNLLVPQLGPGKDRDQPFDYGRARETGSDCDRYAFRTPTLRNVSLTGPWMHNGAFDSLEAAIRHHLQPMQSLQTYDPSGLQPIALQNTCQEGAEMQAALQASQSVSASEGIFLTDAEMADLLAFLHSLTSPTAADLRHTIPLSVPSGLSVGGNIQNTEQTRTQP